MKFPVKSSGDFQIAPAGAHIGIVNAVVDIGLQKGSTLYPTPRHQLWIRWELPNERIKFKRDGKEVDGPMTISRIFTASMHEKAALRKMIEAFFAKRFPSDESAGSFDVTKLVGRHCMLNIQHTEGADRVYANIAGVSPLPKGMEKSVQGMENDPLIFDLGKPDESTFQKLPQWLMNKINSAIEEKPQAKSANDATKPDAWMNPAAKEEGDPGPFVDDDLSGVSF